MSFMEKGGITDRVKSFREINIIEDHSRARPGFDIPTRNGLRMIQNLIKSRPSMVETGLAGRENGFRSQKQK